MQKLLIRLMALNILIYFNYLTVKNMKIENLFEDKRANLLNRISYIFPIRTLCADAEIKNEKNEKMERQLEKLNLDNFFTVRTFMALKAICFIGSILVYGAFVVVASFLKGENFVLGDTLPVFAVLILFSFAPTFIVKKKQKEYDKFYCDESMILQLFMVFLIQSDSTVENILFSFSKMESFYKKNFEKAYRISLRNKKEALEYLEHMFKDIKFGSSFNALGSLADYSRKDITRILQSNLKSMEDDSINEKRKEELKKFSVSQMSVIVPFMVVVFLGAVPIINWGSAMMTGSFGGLY